MTLVSIIIPCYRSAKTIEKVVQEIDSSFMKRPKYEYELILVNDGSPDETFAVIREICKKNPNVTGVDLSRNFGQRSAKMAGVQYVHGDVMITMDDDGQHPAEEIFTLLQKLEEGYDLVYASFPQKKHSWFKRFGSWVNGVSQNIIGQKSNKIAMSSFAAYGGFAIKMIKECNSPVTAMSNYVRRMTKKVCSVPVEHRERIAGKSNYSLKRMLRLWETGLTSFNTRTLELSRNMGLLFTVGSFIYAAFIIIRKLVHPTILLGYSSMMFVILLCSGMIMLAIGILGDYIGQIYLILVRMPNYLVREEIPGRFQDQRQISESVSE